MASILPHGLVCFDIVFGILVVVDVLLWCCDRVSWTVFIHPLNSQPFLIQFIPPGDKWREYDEAKNMVVVFSLWLLGDWWP